MNKPVPAPERIGKVGALVVLSCCFLASAALRTGEVIAALPAGGDDGYGNPVVAHPDPDLTGAGGAGEPEAEPGTLVAEIKRRTDELNQREAQLDNREQELRAVERRLRERLEEIRVARERLAGTAALVDDAAGKDVRRLTEMYQQMKPKQAGLIFNEMAPSFAAGFLAEMRPDVAALIMANMEAEKAYAVSLLIASRNLKQKSAPGASQTGTE